MKYPTELDRLWGRNIRRQRLALNSQGHPRTANEPSMTQEQLAAMLDTPVDQSTITRWENGDAEPRRDHKIQLARTLHRDVNEMFPMISADVA
jgi:DNA-binding XRE family transcriptional regulator